jgi:predicted small secreted protein
MRQIIFIVAGCAFIFSLVGCETIKGLGKDVENTGRNIQEALSKDKGGS